MRQAFVVLALLALLGALAAPASAQEPIVRFDTDMGPIDVELEPEIAPNSVAMFLRRVADGSYDNSYFHRILGTFTVQGGGFHYRNGRSRFIGDIPAPADRPKLPSDRGTLAVARVPGQPRRPTGQWFFNLGDNASELDVRGENYTVFGRIVDETGLQVVDAIGALNFVNVTLGEVNSAFDRLPVIGDWTAGNIDEDNLVFVRSIGVERRIWPPYVAPFELRPSMVTQKRDAARVKVRVGAVPEGSFVVARLGDGRKALQEVAVADGGAVEMVLPASRDPLTLTALPPGLEPSSIG